MRAAQLPSVILFDLDDTLITAFEAPSVAWEQVCVRFEGQLAPISPTQLVRAVAKHGKTFWTTPGHAAWRRHPTQARRQVVLGAFQAIPALSDRLDLAIRIADAFTAHKDDTLRLFPSTLPTLEALRSQGMGLALVTNGDAAGQRNKLRRFGLEHRFDHIQIEGEHSYGKPDPRAFRAVLDTLGRPPGEAWMVGDNLHWDVAAPQRLGLYGVWHDHRREGLPAGSATTPDCVISAPGDILHILEGLRRA